MLKIPVFYSEKMLAESGCESPSASKPRHVLSSWQALGVPLEVVEPTPVSPTQLSRAHDPTFVLKILAGTRPNGFGNSSMEVAASLPYTSGSMLSGAREALRNGKVAVAPCSGFHHAGYKRTEGFCTFNGLMVTAMALREEGLPGNVAILDLDQHYGNGTDDILHHFQIDWVHHFTGGRTAYKPSDAEPFLKELPSIVEGMRDCGILLYQAGADMHIHDPYGGWMTTEQLHRRDQAVFETAKRVGLPVVWNLAGGYQTPLRKVLDIHDNTMRACAATYL